MKSQACTCCHSKASPMGGAYFDVDREGSFANQFADRGLAHAAGWINSVSLGAFPGADNSGFQKSDDDHPTYSIFMSTDPARMVRFFEGELAHRGLTRATFEGQPDGFGPLTTQLTFRPSACERGEGVQADGTVCWTGGRARYVYVMEASARSPTLPPNLDLPRETLWRLDGPEAGAPLRSGTVTSGVVPEGLRQHFPLAGPPAPLVSGRQHYLYVTADVLVPLSRCLFTAP